jgi:hypothetical protein
MAAHEELKRRIERQGKTNKLNGWHLFYYLRQYFIRMKKFFRCASYSLLFTFILISCKDDDSPSITTANNAITENDFLSDKKYNSLTVEIKYVNGYAPASASLDNLKAFLQSRLNKPSGITFTQSGVVSPGKSVFTFSDIQNLEKQYRTLGAKGKNVVAYFFFADGDYTEDTDTTKVLGAAYGTSSMVIFEKTIKDLSGGLNRPSTTTLESIVLEHEFGHILGLVNNGTPMQTSHQDTAHGAHCNNANCLMNYKVESSSMILRFGSTIPSLDANCLADLKGNGGK